MSGKTVAPRTNVEFAILTNEIMQGAFGLKVDEYTQVKALERENLRDHMTDIEVIIVAHNHPTGGLEPSLSDVEVTTQLKAAGIVIGIALLDHIIFNRSGYFSFLEAGRL